MPTLDRPTMLIVGGGFPQLSLIEAVRARGFRVAVAEDREDAPGFAIADRHVICPLLGGPGSVLDFGLKEDWDGEESQAGRDHRQVARG